MEIRALLVVNWNSVQGTKCKDYWMLFQDGQFAYCSTNMKITKDQKVIRCTENERGDTVLAVSVKCAELYAGCWTVPGATNKSTSAISLSSIEIRILHV